MALPKNYVGTRVKRKEETTSKDIPRRRKNEFSEYEKEKILREVKLPPSKVVQSITGRVLYDSPLFFLMLAAARIYLCITQTGYIHPDEFHQSLQINAYDVLGLDAAKPWEYTSGAPIRSVMFSGLTSLPYAVLKYLSPYSKGFFDVEIITPRTLLILPRLFFTFLSFICDFCVYKIACCCYVRPWQCVEVFAGSYIMLVFASRTLSNNLEVILYSLLLWRVSISMVDSTKIIRLQNVLNGLYETAQEMKDKVKIVRTKRHLPSYNFKDSFFISVLVTFGCFVRPTFIVFAFVPLAYWLQRGVVTRELDFRYFNLRCFSLVPGVIVTFVICVLIDSFYYNSITFAELVRWNVTSTSFTVTPLNFLLYNSKSSNLAVHGLHPYLLHITVNIPMLYGILGISGLWSVSKYSAYMLFRRMSRKPKIYSIASMLLTSFIFPVLILSLIPHQEPRFLLPLLLPLVLLHSNQISIYAIPKFRFTKHFCFLLWQLANILGVVFFGYLHQGGVTRALVYVHDYVVSQPPTNEYQVYFSHMYTPPTFLLMRKIPVVGVTDDGRQYRVRRTVTTHDLQSSLRVDQIFSRINKMRTKDKNQTHLLCISASLSIELQKSRPQNVTVERLVRLPGHVSLEFPPPFHLSQEYATDRCNKACQISKRIREFSLDIYQINFGASQSKGPSIVMNETHDEL